MPGSAAHRLNERIAGPQEAFLIRVENRHKRDLGQIETFTKQINADEDIEFAPAEAPENLDTFQRLDLGVQIPAADSDFGVVLGQVLGHSLGECCHQNTLVFLGALADLVEQIVDLAAYGPHFHLRIGESGRPDDLFDNDTAGLRQFVRTRRCGNIDELIRTFLEFLECEGAVVQRGRQPESVFNEVFLSRAIAVVHTPKLGRRLMALVDKHQ